MIEFPKTQSVDNICIPNDVKAKRRRPLSLPSFDFRLIAATLRSNKTESYKDVLNHRRIELGIDTLKRAVSADREKDNELACMYTLSHKQTFIERLNR